MKRILSPTPLRPTLPCTHIGETMKDLVERDGLFYKKFTDVPFTATTTAGEEQGSFNNGKKGDPWVRYYDNGQLWSKRTYKNSVNVNYISPLYSNFFA